MCTLRRRFEHAHEPLRQMHEPDRGICWPHMVQTWWHGQAVSICTVISEPWPRAESEAAGGYLDGMDLPSSGSSEEYEPEDEEPEPDSEPDMAPTDFGQHARISSHSVAQLAGCSIRPAAQNSSNAGHRVDTGPLLGETASDGHGVGSDAAPELAAVSSGKQHEPTASRSAAAVQLSSNLERVDIAS